MKLIEGQIEIYIDYRKVKKPIPFDDVIVEIGFGSGDFLINLARERQSQLFFGIEKSWISVEKLIKKAKINNLKNILCTKLDAFWAMQLLFRDESVKLIILNYPDPWFKKSHRERRLTRKECLFIFAKKLKREGEIRIRTDDYAYLEFTREQAQSLDCFDIVSRRVNVTTPSTKYENKWLSLGRQLWEMTLNKVREPINSEIPTIEEVDSLYPLKVESIFVDPKALRRSEHKVDEGLYLKIYEVWSKGDDYALEVTLSESNFVQNFMVTVKRRDGYFIIDISNFSEIVKTKGVKEALNFIKGLLKEGL